MNNVEEHQIVHGFGWPSENFSVWLKREELQEQQLNFGLFPTFHALKGSVVAKHEAYLW